MRMSVWICLVVAPCCVFGGVQQGVQFDGKFYASPGFDDPRGLPRVRALPIRGRTTSVDRRIHAAYCPRGSRGGRCGRARQRGTTMRDGHAVSAQRLLGVWNECGGD